MAYAPGLTRYWKKKNMDALAAQINAGGLKIAFHAAGTPPALDANADPAAPLTYDNTLATEMSAVGTGYTTGGYVMDEAVVAAPASAPNAYGIKFSSVGAAAGTVALGAGTVATGNYPAVIYDTADLNRIIAICTVAVTVASSGGAMTFIIPEDALKLT